MAVSRDRTGGTGQHNALMRHIVRPCKNCRSLRRPTMAVRGLCRRTHAAVKIIAAVPSVRSGRLLGKNRPTRERKGKSREFRRCWSPRSHTVRGRSALGWWNPRKAISVMFCKELLYTWICEFLDFRGVEMFASVSVFRNAKDSQYESSRIFWVVLKFPSFKLL